MKKVNKLANEIRELIKIKKHKTNQDYLMVSEVRKILDKHAPIEKPFPKHMICISNDDGGDAGKLIYFIKSGVGIPCNESIGGTAKGIEFSRWIMSCFKDCEIQVKHESM